jgi:hypothetical protein
MTVPLPQSFEMMADLGTLTVCRIDAVVDYAAAVSAADNAALREALREYIAAADNSVRSSDPLGAMLRFGEADKAARAALGETT